MDEILWSKARDTAEEELAREMQVEGTWEEYYLTMCKVGKCLLAAEVQRKTQSIYDYKATKKFQKLLKKDQN